LRHGYEKSGSNITTQTREREREREKGEREREEEFKEDNVQMCTQAKDTFVSKQFCPGGRTPSGPSE
jgi:hypothetical protein